MAAAEERIRILKMIQNGQITVEEGNRLLEALKGESRTEEREKGSRQFRIQVTDLETGRQKVELRLPLSLVNVGLNMGACFACEEIEAKDFIEAIRAGAEGKIMDVVDEERRERVEMFVE